jgi:RHS repeat-associated protein
MTSDGNNVYTYDAENRITQVNLPGTGGALVATYVYDADSHRIQKMSTVGNYSDPAGTWIFFYDLAGRWVQEFTSPANTFVRGNIYAGGRHLAFLGGGATTFSHSDWLGTERFRVGMGITPYAYESCSSLPFGDGLSCNNSDISPAHFTGKDRDAATGLDYFGARYNASSFGRFMSPDPKILSIRHLVNPQKWNKYTYTINNPLRYFDPNGMEEIEVQLRAFIPQKSVTVMGTTNGGDNRTFSTAANASSRTSITVRIETDASIRANPIISVNSVAGQSTKLDANGNVIKTATATTGLPTVNGTRDANGNVVLNFQQDTKNPLSPGPQFLTPGITTDLSVTVNPSSVTAAGTTSGFPGIELNVTPDGQRTTNIPLNDPGPNGSPLSLLSTNTVFVSQPLPPPLPPCATDKDKPCPK